MGQIRRQFRQNHDVNDWNKTCLHLAPKGVRKVLSEWNKGFLCFCGLFQRRLIPKVSWITKVPPNVSWPITKILNLRPLVQN